MKSASSIGAWQAAPALALALASSRVRLSDTLPAQPTTIFGREAELATLRDLLWRADRRLVTLLGPGGIGKTRLALAAAAAVAADFADGVAFVDLSVLTDEASVPLSIVAALGLRGKPTQTGQALLHSALQERDLLLVLDNCEHLPGIAQIVNALLGACPRLVILATSRTALRLRWEQRVHVAPLVLPTTSTALVDLPDIPAVALFLRSRAGR